MPLFSYKAIDDKGEITKGVADGKHIDDAYNSILASGLYILEINQSGRFSSFFSMISLGGGVARKDVIEFASNLSVMIKAGIPIITALSDIADTTEKRHFKSIIHDIKKSIELGESFSEAVSRHREVFPDIFVKLIAASEETGQFSEALKDITVHLKRMEDMRSIIIRSLIYPLFAFVATSGALIFWLVYVLPQLKELFTTLGVELPPLTRGMIAASELATLYWPVFIIIPVGFYLTIKLLSRSKVTKYYLDSFKLKLPIAGQMVHTKLLALFAEQFRILIAAGITISRSFDIIIDVLDNEVFKEALRKTKEEILLGSTISDSLKEHGDLFPPLAIRIISVGEATGRLPEQFDFLAGNFIEKLEDLSEKIGKAIEPIIILVIGAMFVLLILGLLAPIFDLISTVG